MCKKYKKSSSCTSSAHSDEAERVLDPVVVDVVIPTVVPTPPDEDVVPQVFMCWSLSEGLVRGLSLQTDMSTLEILYPNSRYSVLHQVLRL